MEDTDSDGDTDSTAPKARLLIGFGASAILLIAAVCVAVVIVVTAPRASTHQIEGSGGVSGQQTSLPMRTNRVIYVHVSGAVLNPGLYELTPNSRVMDAIAAAGGFADDAVREAVNLARVLSDGEQLRVLSQNEAADSMESGLVGGKISLNRADAAQLESLPQIGPSLAERIIAYREQHGRFASVDDVLSVAGVGPKTLEAFRDLVTV